MATITDLEVERRLRAWADVTIVSLTLKRAALRGQYQETRHSEIKRDSRKEIAEGESEADD